MEISVSTNEVNSFSVSELDYIREMIEGMNKFNQVELVDNIPSATYVIEIVTNKGCYKEKLSIN